MRLFRTRNLRRQHYNPHGLGYADFFPDRHKEKMFRLARIKPSDVFFDLGCGDASILIYAARRFDVKKAVGFESDPTRNHIAKEHVKREGLTRRISIQGDINEADFSKADVIFHMLPESDEDYEALVQNGIRAGATLVKHDLPLLGFLPKAVDYPFYALSYPFGLASSEDAWASILLNRKAEIGELWHELYYYRYEKGYTKWDIKRFQRILSKRFRLRDYRPSPALL